MNLILIYFILFSNICFNESQIPEIITIPFNVDEKTKSISVASYYSSDDIQINLLVDLSSSLTWTTVQPTTAKKEDFIQKSFQCSEIDNYSIHGYYKPDKISLDDHKGIIPEQFQWFIVDSPLQLDQNQTFSHVLGLGRNFTNSNNDYISVLDKSNFTSYPMFTISYSITEEKGLLIIGDFVETILDFYEYFSLINVFDLDGKWRSILSHIVFGGIQTEEFIKNPDPVKRQFIIRNNFFTVNYPAIFSTTQRYIVVPQNYFERIYEKVFKGLDYCHIIKEGRISKVVCEGKYESELIKNIPIIHFVFSGVALAYLPNDLFEKDSDNSKLIFGVVSYDSNKEWIFGYYFLKKFIFSFFRDSPNIGVYSFSDKLRVTFIEDKPKILICLHILLITVSSWSVLLVFSLRKFQRKN